MRKQKETYAESEARKWYVKGVIRMYEIFGFLNHLVENRRPLFYPGRVMDPMDFIVEECRELDFNTVDKSYVYRMIWYNPKRKGGKA